MSELKSLCGNAQKSISTSLFDFHSCWSDATCAILQKIQAVEIGVLTQTLKLRPPREAQIRTPPSMDIAQRPTVVEPARRPVSFSNGVQGDKGRESEPKTDR